MQCRVAKYTWIELQSKTGLKREVSASGKSQLLDSCCSWEWEENKDCMVFWCMIVICSWCFCLFSCYIVQGFFKDSERGGISLFVDTGFKWKRFHSLLLGNKKVCISWSEGTIFVLTWTWFLNSRCNLVFSCYFLAWKSYSVQSWTACPLIELWFDYFQ